MPNSYFQFQQFRINQEKSGMKVTTDACLFGAWVADAIKQGDEPKRILDIGGGTGLLSLMLAQITNDSLTDAVEINEQAYEEASFNFQQSPWNGRLKCHHLAIQDFRVIMPYDLVICNPPFFDGSQKGAQTHKNEALHSTHLSMKDLLEVVRKNLKVEGTFYLLYPDREMEVLIQLAAKYGLFLREKVIVRNQDNQPVFRVMASFGLEKQEVKNGEIIIREKEGKYTSKFWRLLKGYYLEYNDPALKSQRRID